MNRIEVNCATGEVKVIPLTKQEFDAFDTTPPEPRVNIIQIIIDELAKKLDASPDIKKHATKE